MPKRLKFLLGLLLLPFCFGSTEALIRVLRVTGDADTVWVPLAGGVICWVAIYALLPKPMWLYVAGHELTHAIWTWMFGGRVRRIRIRASGGQVVVTRNNFLITLAPYFFPFYAVCVSLVFIGGHLGWDWTDHLPWFHLLVGAAYAFHLTLTIHVLRQEQSDIASQGFLFSAAVIWLGNVLVLLVAIPLLTAELSLVTALQWALESAAKCLAPIRWWLGA